MSNKFKSCIFTAFILALSILFSACGSSSETLLKIGNSKVGFDEYRYFYMNCLTDLKNNSDSDTVSDSELTADIESILKSNYAIYDLADEHKISLNDEDMAYISEQISYTKATYTGDETFEDSLTKNYLTEDVYSKLLELNQLKYKLYSALSDEYSGIIQSDDATVEADVQENFMHASQIFISKTNGKADEENLSLAKDISEKIKAGESFDQLKSEYSETTTMYDIGSDRSGEYYFTYGEMIEEFENAVKDLEINEISNVVESVYGYHIIKRLPMDAEYINKNFEDFRYTYTVRVFNEIVAERAAELKITYTEAYNELDKETLLNGITSE